MIKQTKRRALFENYLLRQLKSSVIKPVGNSFIQFFFFFFHLFYLTFLLSFISLNMQSVIKIFNQQNLYNMLEKAFNSWQQFIRSFDFDPEMGYMVSPTHTITSFNYSKLTPILQKLSTYQEANQLQQLFQEFPDLQLKQERTNSDMLILHDSLCFVLQYFLLYCKLIKRQIKQSVLPKNIAIPLYIASRQLKLKYGLCLSVQSNWIPNNRNYETQNFTFQDFELRATFSNKYEAEKWFFGGSLIASFYIGKMMKNIFEINKIIEIDPMKIQLVVERLNKIKIYWDKIIKENRRIVTQLDKDFFWHDIRPMVGGFKDLIFEGVQDNKNLALSSTGGAGGTDPSFQIFQRAFGIVYDGGFASSQAYLIQSMTSNHISLIAHFQKQSFIREYCKCDKSLIQAYNEVIKAYSQFLRVHTSFIEIFILKYMPKPCQSNPEEQKKTEKAVSKQLLFQKDMKKFQSFAFDFINDNKWIYFSKYLYHCYKNEKQLKFDLKIMTITKINMLRFVQSFDPPQYPLILYNLNGTQILHKYRSFQLNV